MGGGFFRRSRWGEPDREDLELAGAMTAYWTRFAATGDPNQPGLPAWPQYDIGKDLVLELGRAIKPIPVPHAEQFSVFERILKSRLGKLGHLSN